MEQDKSDWSELCCQDQNTVRRSALRAARDWNGLDYVEVGEDQTTLYAWFLGRLPPEFNTPDSARFLRISGGRRITDIPILAVQAFPAQEEGKDDYLQIKLARYGDFSTYTLHLQDVANVDARYASADFSFKINCPSDFDCAPCHTSAQAAPVYETPLLNYMAKDYASFRQLLLDRMALIMPQWRERHAPDLGVTLLELLAYSADQLSYYQDAVATEAYLETARQRISVRRHARLVDYRMHEGCNARAWLCFHTDTDFSLPLNGAAFLTGANEALAGKPSILQWDDVRDVARNAYEVFEPVRALHGDSVSLRAAHNLIELYTWGGEECKLPVGATRATLRDAWLDENGRRALQLQAGDVLILEEIRHPQTGQEADARISQRHALRLRSVQALVDEILRDEEGRATPVLEVSWDAADALPFCLQLSSSGQVPDCQALPTLAVARGNVILVDAGQSVGSEDLGQVQAAGSTAACVCDGQMGDVVHSAAAFRPQLQAAPLIFAEALPQTGDKLPAASAFFQRDPRQALPALEVSDDQGQHWAVSYDLIDALPHETRVVVETDDAGRAHLRFGNGELGAAPRALSRFAASYRVGLPLAGNVGADSIVHMVLPDRLSGIGLQLRNPLPASGGQAPEPVAEVKAYAPHAFRQQLQRAILAEDYARLAERHPALQRAACQLVWTGSWNEAEVGLDPLGSESLSPQLLAEVEALLENYRRMGHDLHVKAARYVALDLALQVCVLPGYQAAHVLRDLQQVFGSGRQANGELGFFHPDALSFGQSIYCSHLVARGMRVPGVECVTVTCLQRLFGAPNHELENGVLPLASWEIAQLDNDINFPERGKLRISIAGGR